MYLTVNVLIITCRLKMDITSQNLKELGLGIHAALKKQQELITNMMTTYQSKLMMELSTQESNIETEIDQMKEQEGTLEALLSHVHNLRTEMTEQMQQIKLQHAKENDELQHKLADMMQKQEHDREQLTIQQEQLREELAEQQKQLKQLLDVKQQDFVSSLNSHKEELSKHIMDKMVEVMKDFLYLFETTKFKK